MIFDAHVHVGYYSRLGFREPFYYSPRRVFGVLSRCNVNEFIVSSTCAQVECISIADLNREARELKRIAGCRAHMFLWVSSHVYKDDPYLNALDEMCEIRGRMCRLYEGVKLHECETPWYSERRRDLLRIVSMAAERNLVVQLHSMADGCTPRQLAEIAGKFPEVRFDFAHCHNMKEMSKVLADCPNVWSDTAYLLTSEFARLQDYDWHGRLMFGTDLPVWQSKEEVSLTSRYHEYIQAAKHCQCKFGFAFSSFIENATWKVRR